MPRLLTVIITQRAGFFVTGIYGKITFEEEGALGPWGMLKFVRKPNFSLDGIGPAQAFPTPSTHCSCP